MIHELDAVVAHLYGLSEPQLFHIFKTFHEGWDYQDPPRRRAAALQGMEESMTLRVDVKPELFAGRESGRGLSRRHW